MTETVIRDFLQYGKVSDAIRILQEFKQQNLPNIVIELGKFFKTIFPKHTDLLLQICQNTTGNFEFVYDTMSEITDMNITEPIFSNISCVMALCIPHISNRYIEYNPKIVQKILNRPINNYPIITFTITTCKRYDLFEKTMNSFLNCCMDIEKIDKWLCVDDNSNEDDRKKMQENYPFIEFYFKTFTEKGHPQSMNIIREKVTTPYIFHMEDDWKFVSRKNYITHCMDVISQSDKIGQCLINKNYSETEKDVKIIGGVLNRTNAGTRYFLHQYCATKEEYDLFYKSHGCIGANCAYWKHFSLRPSLLKKHILTELGPYNEKISHFEAEYSDKYLNAGYISAFLDGIYSLHIGRLTSERFDQNKANAYILNGEKQLGGKEEAIAANYVSLNVKIYVLNLDRRPDRWTTFINHEEPKCLNYQRFSAVDGAKLTPNVQLQRIFEGNDYQMRQGMVGCALSHIEMWIELTNSTYDAFCILEDDLEFVPDFREKFLHVYNNLQKNWDLCYLGHHLWKQYKTSDFFDKKKMPITEKWNTEQSLVYSMGGTGGYLISRNGALRLLEFINQMGMTNGIDTMQQKAADILNVYYCKPHLIYSDCWTPETNPDTDIQHDFHSLDLQRDVKLVEWPERLKKDGKYDISTAIAKKPSKYFIACSETTHVYESLPIQNISFPFDSTDGGNMEDFAEIITKVVSLQDVKEFLNYVENFYTNNSHKIIFPHDNIPNMYFRYAKKFQNLYAVFHQKDPIIIVHVSRWKKTDVKVFQNLADLLLKYNPNSLIITVNGLENNITLDEKYNKVIIRKSLEFSDKFISESWDSDKIAYDQSVFRPKLKTLLQNIFRDL